jgi:hypothetical protein
MNTEARSLAGMEETPNCYEYLGYRYYGSKQKQKNVLLILCQERENVNTYVGHI